MQGQRRRDNLGKLTKFRQRGHVQIKRQNLRVNVKRGGRVNIEKFSNVPEVNKLKRKANDDSKISWVKKNDPQSIEDADEPLNWGDVTFELQIVLMCFFLSIKTDDEEKGATKKS